MALEAPHPRNRPLLITLTGPEGSGKSTNQDFIIQFALSHGLHATMIKGDRYTCGHALQRLLNPGRSTPMKRRQYIAEPAPASQTTSGVQARPGLKRRLRTLRRGICYPIDALTFRLVLCLPKYRRKDLIVFDRYIYDEMARIIEQLPRLVSLIHRLSLRPDLAFLITADPDDLVARRPGSSRAYYDMSLRRFRALADGCPELIVIPPGDLAAIQAAIQDYLEPLLPAPLAATTTQAHSKV
ncbi:MAG: hypothetical protein LAT64_07830 [Phycisphaerales bacterium]|nr:hypothetical protein [Planctomycetota bacterium]MCH8508665.1 hypothetical protein [Phycisphaerales bacterium]